MLKFKAHSVLVRTLHIYKLAYPLLTTRKMRKQSCRRATIGARLSFLSED